MLSIKTCFKTQIRATWKWLICDCIGLLVYNVTDTIWIFLVSQAPAVDVVGVGLQSGKIILHNLKFDEVVMTFHQDWGPVTALSFRTGIAATTRVKVNVCFIVMVNHPDLDDSPSQSL